MEREYKRDKRSPIPKNSTVSKVMSSIKQHNTKPELLFRDALYKAGVRGYRINYNKLPGKPDIAFTKKRVVVFIHGCFWHGCKVCGGRIPKYNSTYWANKFQKNMNRDLQKRIELEKMDYTVIEIWEHEIKEDLLSAVSKVLSVLNGSGN